MPAGIDAVERVPHGALLVDDESGARDAGFPGSVGFLLVHHAVFPAHLALGVREQPDRNAVLVPETDRKSTRLNSSHGYISYAVFCLKKKKKYINKRIQCDSTRISDTGRLQ